MAGYITYRDADAERTAEVVEATRALRLRQELELEHARRAFRRSDLRPRHLLAPLATAAAVTTGTFGLAYFLLRYMPTTFFSGYLSFGGMLPLLLLPPVAGLVAGFVVFLRRLDFAHQDRLR